MVTETETRPLVVGTWSLTRVIAFPLAMEQVWQFKQNNWYCGSVHGTNLPVNILLQVPKQL